MVRRSRHRQDSSGHRIVHSLELISTAATNMRGILVGWLVEVAEEYKLISDTLYLTVSYIDRFLSANSLNQSTVRSCSSSASPPCSLPRKKYEEISAPPPPNVEDFCYITANTYMKQELVKMESDILNILKFEMGNPTTKTFLRWLFIISGQEDKKFKGVSTLLPPAVIPRLCRRRPWRRVRTRRASPRWRSSKVNLWILALFTLCISLSVAVIFSTIAGQADEDQLLQAGEEQDHGELLGCRRCASAWLEIMARCHRGAWPEITTRCQRGAWPEEIMARCLVGGDHGEVLGQRRT
ncbi:hypothetical protein ACQ4PT_018683 [Festuca glaucescens]